jgi:tetratricopeptide (TPR) repeat protein
MPLNFVCRYKKTTFASRNIAEQKNQNEHLNVEDALTQSEAFLVKYKNAIIGGVVAVIIIVAGFIMYKNLYAEPREEKAQAALFKGQEYFEQDAYEQALNGDSIGYVGFLKVADEYSGTKAANLAKAYAGICYAQLGKYDEAVKMLDGFNGGDQMVAPAILGATGNCYAQLGQLDKAASTLLSAADKADNNSLSPIFLMQAGEILVKQGKYDDAVNAYTKIKDKYFQSYQAMDIDKYIEQAKLMKK